MAQHFRTYVRNNSVPRRKTKRYVRDIVVEAQQIKNHAQKVVTLKQNNENYAWSLIVDTLQENLLLQRLRPPVLPIMAPPRRKEQILQLNRK
jgi:hypothetical protein